MKPILFYGVPSGCSFGSIVALEWLEIPYQLCRVGMPEEVSSHAYKNINLVGETPSLMVEGGRIISESMAIFNHLSQYGVTKNLSYLQGTLGFDKLNQALAFLNTSYFNAFSPLWYSLDHAEGGEDKRVLIEYGRNLVRKSHADLESMLADKPYLLGNHRTFADAYFMGIARWTDYHDVINRSDYPKLQRLVDKLESDPAVIFAHAIEDGNIAKSAGGFSGQIPLSKILESI